jgi:nitrite reductase (NADH) small subunit/3-phenylpropionate/trans-cinnamate dioxygenase ferredoxin subunit
MIERRADRIANARDVPPGTMCIVSVQGRAVALCNVEGTFHAIDNACPHRGGPLGEGELDGTVVTCPWHGWRWDVTTGASLTNPALRVGRLPVTVQGDDVVVSPG